jgi:hypothetical protein
MSESESKISDKIAHRIIFNNLSANELWDWDEVYMFNRGKLLNELMTSVKRNYTSRMRDVCIIWTLTNNREKCCYISFAYFVIINFIINNLPSNFHREPYERQMHALGDFLSFFLISFYVILLTRLLFFNCTFIIWW